MQPDKSAAYHADRFIAVDKPPVALRVRAISAKLRGCTPFALLNQQVTARFVPLSVPNSGRGRVRPHERTGERNIREDGPMAR